MTTFVRLTYITFALAVAGAIIKLVVLHLAVQHNERHPEPAPGGRTGPTPSSPPEPVESDLSTITDEQLWNHIRRWYKPVDPWL